MKKIYFLLLFQLINRVVFAQLQLPLTRQDSATILNNLQVYQQQLDLGKLREASDNLNNVAMIYWSKNYFQEAITYYEKSLKLNEQLQNENAIEMLNSNLALINTDMGNYNKALEYFQKTLATRIANKETIGTIAAYINMSVVYNNLNRYDESIDVLLKALDLARSLNDPEQMRSCYGMLSETYQKKGDIKNSLYYYEYYKSFHELVQNEKIGKINQELENEKLKLLLSEEKMKKNELEIQLSAYKLKIAEKELSESEKKRDTLLSKLTRQELENEYLKKEKELQEIKSKQQLEKKRKVLNYIIFGTIALSLILFFAIWGYLNKRKDNKKLLQQKEEILLQKEEILQQKEEITYAKNTIEKINKNLTSSINYAKYIQEATLNPKAELDKLVASSFILYVPRDIVSGDFYWFNKVNNKVIVSAIDCTGHGVPGGFLSMIANTLMNKIILYDKTTNPAEILSKLDFEVSKTLKQKDSQNIDGMDMTICTIDYEDNTFEFAGAKNPMFLIQNNEINIVKGDKFSIGGFLFFQKTKTFVNHKFNIISDTYIYLFSDGYSDQLGGPKGFSIGTKRFAEIIFNIHKESPDKQINLLKQYYNDWRKNQRQIDDVLVLGVKL